MNLECSDQRSQSVFQVLPQSWKINKAVPVKASPVSAHMHKNSCIRKDGTTNRECPVSCCSQILLLLNGPILHYAFLPFPSPACLINLATYQLLPFYLTEQDNPHHNQLLQCLALNDPLQCFIIINWQNALDLPEKKRKLMHGVSICQQKASQGNLLLGMIGP